MLSAVLRYITFLLLLASPFAWATQEVVSKRVTVLFEEPSEQAYAERVAVEAERALDKLIPLFGFEPPPITLRLEDTTDLYNAFASPLPRRGVSLRRLFPSETALSYRAEDDLQLLLIHELTHIMQFSYLGGRGTGLRLGLVGEGIANVPPAWLIEGLAVWNESELTTGGRRDDALTRGLLASVALTGTWPSLTDASLATYSGWPGGMTEYLFGVGFTSRLIEKHGFGAVLDALAQHNSAGFLRPFSASWELAVGTDLEAEWQAWQRTVKAEAGAHAVRQIKRQGRAVTSSGWYTRAPALSPDGRQLAWVGWPGTIMLAEVHGGELQQRRVLLDDRAPETVRWLGPHTLVYARPVPRPKHTYSELFTLDTRTGREVQLTEGARASRPAALPNGCIVYLTDDGTRSRLMHLCPERGAATVRYRTAAGTHLVGLATSRSGRVAMSIWRRGFVDLALFEAGKLRFITQDRAQDLEPNWQGEGALLFRSDRSPTGAFDLYRVALDTPDTLTRMTATVGGAFTPEAGRGGLWFSVLGGQGYDIAWLLEGAEVGSSTLVRYPLPSALTAQPSFSIRPYKPLPSLAPYGWLPTSVGARVGPLGVFGEASLLAQDDSSDHALRATLGYDTALPALYGLYGYVRYDYGDGGLPLRATPRPLRYSLQVGVWPFTPHLGRTRGTALGVQAGVRARLPEDRRVYSFGLETSLVHFLGGAPGVSLDVRAEGAISARYKDVWGYDTEGWRVAATGVLGATGGAPSLGAWLDGLYVQPVGALGRLVFGLRAGYRPAWPIPLEPGSDAAALFTFGLTKSLPVGLRFGDGLYALERVTLEPKVRTWVGNALYLGGDLTVSLDTVLSYGAPVAFSGTLGYAGGLWTRLGIRLPL